MRLDFAELFPTHHGHTRNAVGNAALVKALQPSDLVLRGGKHQLAAFFVWNTLLLAEALHGSGTCDAIASFHRSGTVVEAGMNDAAVMTSLMAGKLAFFFYENEAKIGEPGNGTQCGCEAYDTAADDQ